MTGTIIAGAFVGAIIGGIVAQAIALNRIARVLEAKMRLGYGPDWATRDD